VLSGGDAEGDGGDDAYESTLRDLWGDVSADEFDAWEDDGDLGIWRRHFSNVAHLVACHFETREKQALDEALDLCLDLGRPVPKTLKTARALHLDDQRSASAIRRANKSALLYMMADLQIKGMTVERSAEVAAIISQFWFGDGAGLKASVFEKQFPAWRRENEALVESLRNRFERLTPDQKKAEQREMHEKWGNPSGKNPIPEELKGSRRV